MQIEELIEKVESLTAKVEELESRLAEIDGNLEGIVEDYVESALSDVSYWMEEAEDFADLDADCNYTDENVLILHTNRFRTAMLVSACKPSNGGAYNLIKVSPDRLTPDNLYKTIRSAKKGEYFVFKGNVFSCNNEFTQVIMNAIIEGKVYFAIVTNDPRTIPQQILEHLRVVQ